MGKAKMAAVKTMQRGCRPYPTPSVDAWYINVKSATERSDCMERQFRDAGFHSVNRFDAVMFPKACRLGDLDCMKRNNWTDCIGIGIVRYELLTLHGGAGYDRNTTAKHAWSNYCSHYRLFNLLGTVYNNKIDAPYVIIFEDDVVISDYFLEWVQHFICSFKGKQWDVIQIEPFGQIPGEHLMTWRDGNVSETDVLSPRKGNMWGFHALLAKKWALIGMARCMRGRPVIPIDYMHRKCFQGSFFSVNVNPNVVQQPEMFNESLLNWNRPRLPVPKYCAKKVFETMIR